MQVVAGMAVDREISDEIPAAIVKSPAIYRLKDHARDGWVDEEDDPEPERDQTGGVTLDGEPLDVLLLFE